MRPDPAGAARNRFQLTRAELDGYEEDGFLVRESVFSASELDDLRAAAEQTVAAATRLSRHGRTYLLDGKRFVDAELADAERVTVQFEHETGSETIRVIEPAHPLDPRWETLIDDPRIVQPMRQIVGSEDIALWTDKLNLKRPREGSGFRWHQDSPYWIHDCGHVDQLPNVLVALDDATAANGCLRIVRGSHRQGCLPGISDGSQLGGFFTDPARFDLSQERLAEVSAGSLVFFNPHVVHGSQPNHSDQPRRALIMTYQPAGHPMLKLNRCRPAGD